MKQSGGIHELELIEKITRLMDNAFRIPGTNIRFGLDPVIGLFPFVGDLISYGISSSLVIAMVRKGASGKLVVKMIGNITLDYIISNVPVLGYIIDFGFKANERNLNLLKEHFDEGKHQGAGWPYLLAVLLVLLLIMVVLAVGLWLVLIRFFQWLGSTA
ncbi:MAG: hypothetical protein DHS20C17_00590 [Cyclobacteriaceae bacterium]|nr:MAG: hypothetical protein DHS20C17_00590 [Cyclobacteriaceae bacterium]